MSEDAIVVACACWLYKLQRVIYQLITDRFLNTLHHFEEEGEPFKMTIKTSGFFKIFKIFIRIAFQLTAKKQLIEILLFGLLVS